MIVLSLNRSLLERLWLSNQRRIHTVLRDTPLHLQATLSSPRHWHFIPVRRVLRRPPLLAHAPDPTAIVQSAAGHMDRPLAKAPVKAIERCHQAARVFQGCFVQVQFPLLQRKRTVIPPLRAAA